MGVFENRVAKVIWRALSRHVKANHQLQVRRMPESEDLEIHCCWCGNTVMAGSPQVVQRILDDLKDAGARVVGLGRSVSAVA